MRIAICISGFLRTYRYCFKQLFDNVLYDKKNQYDFFIHTWDSLGFSKGWCFDIDFSDSLDLEHVKSVYNPKKIVVENLNNVKLPELRKNAVVKQGLDPSRSISMFRKIYECNELKKQFEKENGFLYDFVVRTRGDLRFYDNVKEKQDVVFEGMSTKLVLKKEYDIAFSEENLNFLHVSHSNYDLVGDVFPEMINDSFGYGSSGIIDRYSEIFLNFNTLTKMGVLYHPETLLKAHIEFNKIQIKKHKFMVEILR